MKLLYLIANQQMIPAVADFVAQVAKKMCASVLVLVIAESSKMLEEAKASVAAAGQPLEGIEYSTKFVQGNPVSIMKEETEQGDYEMLLMSVRRRQRLIPSPLRMLAQRIIRHSPIPVMLIRDTRGKLERMLVCTGGFQISQPVVELSAKLAGQAGLQATLMTVAAAVPSMYTGMMEMEETLEELLSTDTPLAQHLRHSAETLTQSGIQAEIKIRHGDVVEAILEETAKGEYDLVVLGETQRQSLSGMLLGNVTQQIINRAPAAILITK